MWACWDLLKKQKGINVHCKTLTFMMGKHVDVKTGDTFASHWSEVRYFTTWCNLASYFPYDKLLYQQQPHAQRKYLNLMKQWATDLQPLGLPISRPAGTWCPWTWFTLPHQTFSIFMPPLGFIENKTYRLQNSSPTFASPIYCPATSVSHVEVPTR